MKMTIEEAAEEYAIANHLPRKRFSGDAERISFIAGAKSEAAKEHHTKDMYSRSGVILLQREYNRDIKSNYKSFEEWFNDKHPI